MDFESFSNASLTFFFQLSLSFTYFLKQNLKISNKLLIESVHFLFPGMYCVDDD